MNVDVDECIKYLFKWRAKKPRNFLKINSPEHLPIKLQLVNAYLDRFAHPPFKKSKFIFWLWAFCRGFHRYTLGLKQSWRRADHKVMWVEAFFFLVQLCQSKTINIYSIANYSFNQNYYFSANRKRQKKTQEIFSTILSTLCTYK